MGLTVQLITETGDVVESPVYDTTNVLGRVLPTPADSAWSQISYIDPYGDTIFNGLQMAPFLKEWARLSRTGLGAQELSLLDAVEDLATKCDQNSHLYLKFIGD